jgi:NitT/TauT family transport system substrate-binding protein
MSLTARATVACVVAAVLTTAGWLAPAAAFAQAPTKVTFALDFIPLGRHAPWYAAVAQGYFKDEALDVTIIPTKGTAEVIQTVQSGTAQIGFIDVPALVLARAGGSTLKMVAVNYQRAPYAIFSLENGADVTSPRQLEGLTLGSGAGSFTPKIIQGFMAQHGLDPGKLQIANVAPPARASMLMTGQVPAIEFFVMARPGLEAGARSSGTRLATLLLSEHGLDLYSNGIAATDEYLKANPDLMKRFVRAALRGWKFALDNPRQAAELQSRMVAGLKEEAIMPEIAVLRDLAVTPDTREHGLGSFDPARMQNNLDFIVRYVGVTGTAPAAQDLYATGYLPAQPILP